jgi:hypothetical protein
VLDRLVLLLLPLLFSGCSNAPAASCPNETPSCPSPAPGYATDVGPLVAMYCTRCHNPGGIEPTPSLRSYEDVTARQQIAHVLFQINSCRMPPDGEPQPTAAERTLILSWFACCAASDAGVCPP